MRVNPMVKRGTICAVAVIFLTVLLAVQYRWETRSCGVLNPRNSVYYWKTTLKLTALERAFLKDNEIGKVYLRLFDVVRRYDGELMPNASLRFEDTIPRNIAVIPTVYIAADALSDTAGTAALPVLVVNRVDAMMQQNGYATPPEIQIDYDWAATSATSYFTFLHRLRDMLHKQGRKLSATIRLHQLAMPVPPVDYGALMVYNVGKFSDSNESNSIITAKAVAPYLRYLRGYKLPLCVALPAYHWNLIFHDSKFVAITPDLPLGDASRYRYLGANRYVALAYQGATVTGANPGFGVRIYPGDVVRRETSDANTLCIVRRAIGDIAPNITSQIILYHLDEKNLNNYTKDEIEAIFSR